MSIIARATTPLVVVSSIFLIASPASADSPARDLPSPLALTDVLRAVRERNPLAAAGRLRADAASARPRAEGLPDDPMAMLEWWQQPIDFSSVPLMLTVKQSIPWRSRLRLRREAAEREADVAGEDATEALRRAQADARRAYFDLVLAQGSIAVSDRLRALLEHVVEVTQARYTVGKAVQADVMRAQSELLMIANERFDLERTRDEATARLNGLLDRPAAAPLPPTATTPALTTLPDAARLVDEALAHRPDVRRARAQLRAAQARLALAERENLPELAAWAGYMVNVRGVDTFTVGVASTLPVFSGARRTALSEAAQSELAAARLAEASSRRLAEVEVQTALLQLETAARHARLHADKLVPLADAVMDSALASYQAGRVDFLSVLEAARAVRTHHLDHLRYLAEFERRRADLELAVGVDLDATGGSR